MQAIDLLSWIDWSIVASTSQRHWFGRRPVPVAAYLGAYLIKLDWQLKTMAHLRRFLVAHPALIWALGFPIVAGDGPNGFDPEACLPSARHFNHTLRKLPNDLLQQLLDAQVSQLQQRWPDTFGQTISLDTKHILAWVKENNPKAFIKEGRSDKTRQPAGDPNCKLGCKRRHNRRIAPKSEGKPASRLPASIGEILLGLWLWRCSHQSP